MERNIDSILRNEISLKLNKLSKTPEYYDKKRELVIQNQRSIGDVYSFWIENPSLRKEFLLQNKQKKTLQKMAAKGIQNVHNAWYFLNTKGEHNNFIDYLNIETLERTNGLVLGNRRNSIRKNYNDTVTLNARFTPPNPLKVEKKLKQSISEIKQLYSIDPLESAIKAHLDFAGIQPFMEGNKRTSRLIQDRILYDSNLPPAIIPAGEGIFYRNLLGDALEEYEIEGTKNIKKFYDYCASKINSGLDDILGDLEEKP